MLRPYTDTAPAASAPLGSDQPMLPSLGILDASQEPFNADGTGRQDASGAIRAAMEYAKREGLVTYLPAGRYRMESTVEVVQLQRLSMGGQIDAAGFATAGAGASAPVTLRG